MPGDARIRIGDGPWIDVTNCSISWDNTAEENSEALQRLLTGLTELPETTQADIVARIDREIVAYERAHGLGSLANTARPMIKQGGGITEDDPCGWRTL